MAPYILLISCPALLALFYDRRHPRLLLWPVFLGFVLFIGLRYHVGMDWNNYDSIHIALMDEPFWSAINNSEPLSFAVMWLSTELGVHMTLTNVVSAFLLCVGVFACANRTPNPWLGVVAASSYLIIAFGMTGVRQAMAIGIVLYVFAHWIDFRTPQRLVGIGLASLFHTSSLFALLPVLYDMRLKLSHKIVAGLGVIGMLTYSLQSTDVYTTSVNAYVDNYLTSPQVASPGALMHMVLVQGPALIYLLMRRSLEPYVVSPRLIWIGCWTALGVVLVFFASTTAASRLILYLYFIPIAVFPAFAQAAGRYNRLAATLAVGVFHILVLSAWLLFANNSSAHIPYNNILLEDPV